MHSRATTVDEYLAEQAPERRASLTKLRKLILDVAPTADECMRSGMPSYALGELLFALAAQKRYLALYILDSQVVERFGRDLGKLSVGKGCIRFRNFEDLPQRTLRSMLEEAVRRRKEGITSKPCET